MKVGDRVELQDGSHHDILCISEDNGIQLSNCHWYCKTELKLVENKLSKTELIDKAIKFLGGSTQNKGDYYWVGHYTRWDGVKFTLFYQTDDNSICSMEEFEQRKKELEQMNNSWYDYENQVALRLPPVGDEVLWRDARVFVVAQHVNRDAVIISSGYRTGSLTYGADLKDFKPLDWDKLSEKKKLIKQVEAIIYELCPIGQRDAVEKLYELGYLKLPEQEK